ncbi:MAG TPA: hypothetical protein DCE71_01355 [Parachlamydiales bacterium]|nr:hypothetical protein [Parachlamydiales bacterium]
MNIDVKSLDGALQTLGQLLADRGLHYEIAAIGGGSLLLLGLIDRTTKDLDLIALVKGRELFSAEPLPPPLIQAAEEVAEALELGKDWLNIGPASLLEMGLPPGFVERLHIRKYKALTLYLADRFDQICFKLYASVDQGPYSKHFADLRTLVPTIEELQQAKRWCLTQDISTHFEKDLNEVIKSIYATK